MTFVDNLAAVFDFLGNTGLVRALIVAAVLIGLWRGLARAGLPQARRVRSWLAVAVPLLVWFAVIWAMALAGVIQGRAGAPPLLPVAIFAPLLIGLPVLLRSQRIGAALDALPASWLVGLQVYRIFGGTFLLQLALGHVSAAFALPAGIGDVLVGVLALPVAFYLNRDAARGRGFAVAWNLLGILDLIMANVLGFLASTGRLGIEPRPLLYPLVMIPAFAVPLSLLLHAVSLRQLKRKANGAALRRIASAAVASGAA